MNWFSEPQETIEAAQELHEFSFFNPAGVFKTPEGKFVMGLLRCQKWSKEYLAEVANNIKELTGNILVATCDPLFGVWKAF